MKRAVVISGLTAMAIALTAVSASAKGGDREGREGRGGPQMTFEQLDLNADGQVTMDELAAQAGARFAERDTDGDGFLSAEELTAAADGDRAERMAKRVERMLEHRDTDGDGKLSQAEMTPENADERMARMFDVLDSNNDDVISAEEFEEGKKFRGRPGKRGPKGGDKEQN